MLRPVLYIEIGDLVLGSIFLLCGLGLFVAVRGITTAIKESTSIRLDAAALVTGDLMPLEKIKRMARINKRVSGLRLKLVSFTITLVLAVDILVSAPLYIMMTRSQRQTLIKGLLDRATVLLDGLAANAGVFLSKGEIEDIGLLPAQMASIPEAMYVTITGHNPETLIFEDQVWATNDPDIQRKIDTQTLHLGFSRLTDAVSPRLHFLVPEQNSQARGNETLSGITGGIRSEPEYSLENFVISSNRRYLFYKPIMYGYGSKNEFFWGVVRLEVAVNSILNEMDAQQRSLLKVNLLVALAAQAIGALGAFILSTLIIRPIRQLVKYVEIIRDTEDKTRLSGIDIKLKTHDELASLGETINEMTHGLVNAALAATDLSIGKEIQKKFLPLEIDNEGNKLSSGFEETTYLNIFGYYEGAKGVSGDYFDYQDLDGRFYAIIKCDVAGKGIPAAFIMIQVATMFLNYCKQWKATDKGMHIEEVVYQINEFIENLAFKDRFAAFTFCLYDSYTGKARFCNAGDNIIHLYDASEKRIKNLFLPETPAAGVLPNPEVESKGGYSVQTINLDHGDILLLFTDGIEESIRTFRNEKFEEIVCTDGPDGTPHENHVAGQTVEELGFDRVQDIVNSVMNKNIYTLHKWHNGEGENKDLKFDFTSSKGSVEDVIMALISIEKMFRCYYNPKAAGENRVLVDRIVDAFLRKCFLQYRDYCSFTEKSTGNPSYIYYDNIMEDEQNDDLTILGLKRK